MALWKGLFPNSSSLSPSIADKFEAALVEDEELAYDTSGAEDTNDDSESDASRMAKKNMRNATRKKRTRKEKRLTTTKRMMTAAVRKKVMTETRSKKQKSMDQEQVPKPEAKRLFVDTPHASVLGV